MITAATTTTCAVKRAYRVECRMYNAAKQLTHAVYPSGWGKKEYSPFSEDKIHDISTPIRNHSSKNALFYYSNIPKATD